MNDKQDDNECPEDGRPGDIVTPKGCYYSLDHVLSYNRHNFAIQCVRCGEVFIRYLKEIEPGVWVRDRYADPNKL